MNAKSFQVVDYVIARFYESTIAERCYEADSAEEYFGLIDEHLKTAGLLTTEQERQAFREVVQRHWTDWNDD